MTISVHENVVEIAGHATIEDAQPLLETLQRLEQPIFDLAETQSLHTAIVQLILVSHGEVRGVPQDPVLLACFRRRLAS